MLFGSFRTVAATISVIALPLTWYYTAEFRGPGIHHRFDDSPDDYEMDLEQRTRMIGGRGGSIILLRDGTEVLTDGVENENDAEMFDQSSDEEKDLESQVRKGQAVGEGERKREETPGPSAGSDGSSAGKATTTTEERKSKAEASSGDA